MNHQSSAKHRVLLVDDHPVVRQGLTLLINREPDLEVCGEAERAPDAWDAIHKLKPDIVILDLSLDGPDGLDLLKNIRAEDAALPVLILSMHDESLYAERVLRAGAQGYITKQEATERVLVALRRILQGGIYLSDRMSSRLLNQFFRPGTRPNGQPASSVESLSDRELEIFRLIGAGHTTRQIAQELNLSVKTVEAHQAHIKDKLSLKNARELLQHALQWVGSGG